jgi:hypothetical protein
VAGNVWIPGGYQNDFARNLTRERRIPRYDCRQMTDGRVSNVAGNYRVAGARRFGTLNFGRSTATTVSFVIRSVDDAH